MIYPKKLETRLLACALKVVYGNRFDTCTLPFVKFKVNRDQLLKNVTTLRVKFAMNELSERGLITQVSRNGRHRRDCGWQICESAVNLIHKTVTVADLEEVESFERVLNKHQFQTS